MEELIKLGCDFRREQPLAGSDHMICAVGELVIAFDALNTIFLSEDDNTRKRQINALAGMQKIKDHYLLENWEALSRNRLLYGLSPLLDSENKPSANAPH